MLSGVIPVPEMLQELQTGSKGLKGSESSERLKTYGQIFLSQKRDTMLLISCFPSSGALLPLFSYLLPGCLFFSTTLQTP
ncbi:hypothetical protein MSWHS_1559 [Methanosarcina sp. WWM596]|nr:hypothetical protein MSWHS_1559 [Methanosarcina sp. WWM596]AKB22027.1 hypothetical protein MSWH1_1756 [Methanosarcina sp. WH1]